MKLLASLFMLVSFSAFADSIIIEIGGVRHQCTPMGNSNPAQCFNVAYAGIYSREEALRLCAGSFTDAPAKCATRAYAGRYSRTESIDLCIGSTTDAGPVECADLAYSGPFSNSESIELCRLNGSKANVTCALEAYSGPFSKEESINMCKSARFTDEKAMRSEKQYSKVELMKLIEEANLKAFEKKEYK